MYILFEEHQYESRLVERVLKDIYVLQDVNKKVSVQYVGYFYNPHLHDCVFILPKVLLTEQETLVGMALPTGEQVSPEQVLTPEDQKKLGKEYRKFIYEFSVWIYRALSVFYKANPGSKAILYKRLPQAGRGRKHRAETYLDIVLSLIAFNQENRDFVLFTIKNLHRGNNKINWTRTIGHSQAFVQNDEAVYLNPVNKKRIVNYEEELFVIFYSILNYLNNEYGFHTPINIQYDLITGKQFSQYLHGLGKTRLMQIKYKYFSDKALQLWDLCYAFFENSYRIAIHTNAQEYILAKSFNVVFEAMIDELIGTPHDSIPKGLADQDDGKRVDHLYADLALTSADKQANREVYYIGDSKYYKNGHALTSESIYKQYTYARNVIQWNVNLFAADDARFDKEEKVARNEDKKRFGNIRLQDNSLTEGYDVIPNFFISAFVYDDRRYNDDRNNIRPHKGKDEEHCTKVSFQFPDRLFDRDTLFLSQYDVNFLYVLFLYGRNKANEKAQWKQHVRKIFRDEVRQVIEKEFDIYAMRARLGVDGALYLQQHFYDLNGRVFQPYGEGREMYFAYARPSKKEAETQAQYDELKKYFIIEKCNMGCDPQEALKTKIESEMSNSPVSPQWLTLHYLERNPEAGILVGYYRSEEHLKWIMGKNDKGSLVYNVRLKQKGEELRGGAHSADFYKKQNVQFVILYTNGAEETGEYHVFHVKDTASMVSEERMRFTWYPFDVKGSYFFFRFDEEITLGKLDIKGLLEDLKSKRPESGPFHEEPLFSTAQEVLNFRTGF
ncbi:MAG: restriction endonuclease [Paludibacteraceae bacterium]|nr:restriction endonuclease [Paludibacteraceae bacterium]